MLWNLVNQIFDIKAEGAVEPDFSTIYKLHVSFDESDIYIERIVHINVIIMWNKIAYLGLNAFVASTETVTG